MSRSRYKSPHAADAHALKVRGWSVPRLAHWASALRLERDALDPRVTARRRSAACASKERPAAVIQAHPELRSPSKQPEPSGTRSSLRRDKATVRHERQGRRTTIRRLSAWRRARREMAAVRLSAQALEVDSLPWPVVHPIAQWTGAIIALRPPRRATAASCDADGQP